jgi:ABC-2 type transport system ATP-binding protein
VLILNEGRIAAQGTPESIASTIKGGENWDLLLKGTNVDAARTGLETLGLAVSINTIEENTDGTVRAAFFIPSANAGSDSNSSAERIFDWAVANNMKILAMDKKKLSMEDIFVKLTA